MGQCLGIWCEEDQEKPVTHIVEEAERSCTDLLWLVCFLAAWVCLFGILIGAIGRGGNPDLVIKPIDYQGNVCSGDKRYGAWPSPIRYNFKVCLASCAETNTDPRFVVSYSSVRFVYYCVPLPNQVQVAAGFSNDDNQSSRVMADLKTAWPIILSSAFMALILGFVYVWLMRQFAGCVVWTTILVVLGGAFMSGYALLKQADKYKDDTEVDNRYKALQGMGIALIIFAFLMLLFVICFRDRIRIAILVIKEAAGALLDMKSLVFAPVFPFLIGCAYFVFFISVMVYIFSVGSYDRGIPMPIELQSKFVEKNYTDFVWDNTLKYSAFANFFHMLWNINFLIYFTYLAIAGAIADWYFTPYKDGVKQRGNADGQLSETAVWDAFRRTILKHLGSVALGSLIISIVQFIRAMVKYIEAKSRAASGEPNQLQKCMFCCIQCCLRCVECCLDKINKNAFIWTALFGDSFGTAACSSFALVWRNLARAAALELVGEYLIILGKIAICLTVTGICALIFLKVEEYEKTLSSIIMPCVVIFLMSYLIASLFLLLYEVTIDTTFLCFLIDEEHNGAAGRPMLAHDGLKKVFDDHGEHSKKLADQMIKTKTQRQESLGRLQTNKA